MDQNEAQKLSQELMESAAAAILTTINAEGFPRTRAMFNLRHKAQFPSLIDFFADQQNDFLVYFTTNTSSSKMKDIKNNPRAAVYYHRPDEFRGLMLGGMIEIITDENLKRALWQPAWDLYYPGGFRDPDNTVLRLNPLVARYYHRLQSCEFSPGSIA